MPRVQYGALLASQRGSQHSVPETPTQPLNRRLWWVPLSLRVCGAHDWLMGVRLLYFDGCPHWSVADERLRTAMARVGREFEPIEHVLVETPEDAERLRFIGSPTVFIGGRDPFAKGGESFALACRVYTTPEGPAGSPTVDQLVDALL